jgi:hypothetical protein
MAAGVHLPVAFRSRNRRGRRSASSVAGKLDAFGYNIWRDGKRDADVSPSLEACGAAADTGQAPPRARNSTARPSKPAFAGASRATSSVTLTRRNGTRRRTAVYLQGIDNAEIIETVHAR